jgi:hypothetical protein
MDASDRERVSLDGASERSVSVHLPEPSPPEPPSTPKRETQNGAAKLPSTPLGKGTPSRISIKEPTSTPRLKKKVPWRGKNIMVLLPRDDQRGKPGEAPIPLRPDQIESMFVAWEDLGYSIRGFDRPSDIQSSNTTHSSQSRGAWPDFDEVVRERAERRFKVTLPDLNGKQQNP